jgi:RNA polymerase sigma factor (sigma-70 family)
MTREEETALTHDYYRADNLASRTSLIEANLKVASIHAKKRAQFVKTVNKKEIEDRGIYHDLLGEAVKAMLTAIESRKFDVSKGVRISTFFEQVVNGDILDVLKKENLYARRHELCDFLDRENDNQKDCETDGEPVERSTAIRLVVDGQTATEFPGEENRNAAIKDLRELFETGLSAANRVLLMTGLEDDDKTDEEIGAEFGLSGNAVQKRRSRALEKLRDKMNKT